MTASDPGETPDSLLDLLGAFLMIAFVIALALFG